MSAAPQLSLRPANTIWAVTEAIALARKPVVSEPTPVSPTQDTIPAPAGNMANTDQVTQITIGSHHRRSTISLTSQALKARPLPEPENQPVVSFAFYRQHTEKLLRRYHYASMQVGRSPSLLSESVGRGWASSRRVRTFEDAVIFCLDIERCLSKLTHLERQLITRIAVQEYTRAEAASLSGLCTRTISSKYPQALDHLTELLVESDLLLLPN